MIARGRVFRSDKRTWCMEVWLGDVLVDADNTGSWRPIFDECHKNVAAFDIVAHVGHTLRPFADLVDEALT